MSFFFFYRLAYYYFLLCDLTLVMKDFAGLKAGMLCAGIIIVVFFEIFLAVFFALFLTMKLPNPLRYTLFPFYHGIFNSFHKGLYSFLDCHLFDTSVLGNFINNVCFSHFS